MTIVRRLGTTALLPALLAGAVLLADADADGAPAPRSTALGDIRTVASDKVSDGTSHDLSASDPEDFKRAYDGVVEQIRRRTGSSRLYNNIVLTAAGNDYFDITLANRAGDQVSLVFNARNLYVEGYRNLGENRYYRFGGPANPYPGTVRNDRVVERNWLNYADMQRAASVNDRGVLEINQGAIRNAISSLGNATAATEQVQARSMLILVQAFAEAARFDYISYNLGQALGQGRSWRSGQQSEVSSNGSNSGGSMITVSGLDFENDWSALSQAAERSTRNGTAPNVRVGSGSLTTMSAIDAQLALALRS
ncbi:ribosome-inactivating family protein [Streptomyces sp. GbtcB6]|uniref:ribosome-inactivating family protein n=1 Tax=Streptomyces sp. GbtcB6 TaxID=2824751 RepID=UPI001C2F4864|nr:ribosome-inactivating family protein [Streptomyces sp. GbtcB6]